MATGPLPYRDPTKLGTGMGPWRTPARVEGTAAGCMSSTFGCGRMVGAIPARSRRTRSFGAGSVLQDRGRAARGNDHEAPEGGTGQRLLCPPRGRGSWGGGGGSRWLIELYIVAWSSSDHEAREGGKGWRLLCPPRGRGLRGGEGGSRQLIEFYIVAWSAYMLQSIHPQKFQTKQTCSSDDLHSIAVNWNEKKSIADDICNIRNAKNWAWNN